MEDSILITTKKMLNLEDDFEAFDLDVITHINSVFLALNQLGVGPPDGYMITDKTAFWSEYLGTNKNLNAVKSYMYFRVRMMFDPPATSFAIAANEELKKELEFRISVEFESQHYVNPNVSLVDPVYEMPVIDGGVID